MFEEQEDDIMELLDRPPEVKAKEIILVDVANKIETRKGLRENGMDGLERLG